MLNGYITLQLVLNLVIALFITFVIYKVAVRLIKESVREALIEYENFQRGKMLEQNALRHVEAVRRKYA